MILQLLQTHQKNIITQSKTPISVKKKMMPQEVLDEYGINYKNGKIEENNYEEVSINKMINGNKKRPRQKALLLLSGTEIYKNPRCHPSSWSDPCSLAGYLHIPGN